LTASIGAQSAVLPSVTGRDTAMPPPSPGRRRRANAPSVSPDEGLEPRPRGDVRGHGSRRPPAPVDLGGGGGELRSERAPARPPLPRRQRKRRPPARSPRPAPVTARDPPPRAPAARPSQLEPPPRLDSAAMNSARVSGRRGRRRASPNVTPSSSVSPPAFSDAEMGSLPSRPPPRAAAATSFSVFAIGVAEPLLDLEAGD